MLGSNEMMWRRIVDYVDYVDYVDGGVEKRQVKCSKPNTSPPSDRPRSGCELV